ncbi:MAG: bifunctional proline dehydrogenase/L-glutamate gamma-semialdehyde dehydrogenase [Pirellulaceae bacterium]
MTHSMDHPVKRALGSVLAGFQPDTNSPYSLPIQKTLFLARKLQDRAIQLQTPQERRQQAELDRMIQHPRDKATLTQITDQAFRSHSAYRAVDQLTHILDVQGIPRFFSPFDRTLLKGFQSFGRYLPGVAAPLVQEKMQAETANTILPAEEELLAKHLNERRREGLRMIVNILGEALLGESEAEHRLKTYLEVLQRPEIEIISVKISTIFSQIWPLDRAHTIEVLSDRLELLYRAAARSRFKRADGTEVAKFVYLDMEAYRDMTMTSEAFMQALDRGGLADLSAGLVLQSYLPDAYQVQLEINRWARDRVALGGAPITLRLVKGANMEMERVEASVRGWPQAPYTTKRETDANFKRMVLESLKPENSRAVRLAIASHNLFDVAFGLVHALDAGLLERVQFEMLEGMANHQRRALFELVDDLLLYAPASRREDFIHAIGYLVRRLDENTGPENFLRHAFKLEAGSPDWTRLEKSFVESCAAVPDISHAPRRTQDRRRAAEPAIRPGVPWQNFVNEPDTDFALPHHAEWAADLVARWQCESIEHPTEVPLVIAGESIVEGRTMVDCRDPSRPGAVIGRYRQATKEDVDRAVACAQADEDGWRSKTAKQRSAVLGRAAQELREARGDLLGAALAESGKTLLESDPEVSEAVDFVEFYSRAAEFYFGIPGLSARGQGVVAVVSPWNFPIAIPCGGVAAALAAGNTVILKPASDTVLVALHLCECFWRAGVSRKTLQFVPCSGATVGTRLVSHPQVNGVILTGGTETAVSMLEQKPDMRLLAETGGKNATIVTALSDRDLAIKQVVQSAFGHSGQKCSATSLLILEEEVYYDPAFKRGLLDAIKSMEVGSAWDLKTCMGPLIRPPTGVLETALRELEPGESWAVMPHIDEENPNLVTPAVKWGVQPASFTHMTEFFGPVLAVMKARNLREAIEMVNQTGYGLTSGIESLDDREQTIWMDSVRAGNLYVNRHTTGAIVLRQPFGGMGKSAFGPGIKAGGPNYVTPLMRFEDVESPLGTWEDPDEPLAKFREDLERRMRRDDTLPIDDLRRVIAAMESYHHAMREEFGKTHDHFHLVGQDNLRRYLPVREMRVRIHSDDSWFDVLARVCAARVAGCRVTVSIPLAPHPPVIKTLDELTESWAGAIEFVEESDDSLSDVIRLRHTDRIRYAAPERVPRTVRDAVIEHWIHIADTPVLMQGRIELLWYLHEQSVCIDYHRYGNLGIRADEPRIEPF